jgi:hypothetical protein
MIQSFLTYYSLNSSFEGTSYFTQVRMLAMLFIRWYSEYTEIIEYVLNDLHRNVTVQFATAKKRFHCIFFLQVTTSFLCIVEY